MELEFNRQFLALQNELNILKSSLTPLFQLLQDIQDIRKRHHISQANNVSSYSLLLMDIKEDILKEVASMSRLTDDKISDVKQDLSNSIYDASIEVGNVKDEVFKLTETFKEMNSEIFSAKHVGGENKMYIKEIRKELEKKASISNIDEIRTIVRTMTPLNSFDTLKSRVNDCVSVYQFQDMQKKVEVIKDKLKKFMKIEDVNKNLERFTYELDEKFQQSYVTRKLFGTEQESIEKNFLDLNDAIMKTKEYSSKLDKDSKDKILVVKKALESRPWKQEIATIQEYVSKLMPKEELLAFINDTKAQVTNFSTNMYKFKISVESFEKVVERFDEILLDKAEKDQISKINKVLETVATKDSVESIKKNMVNFTKDNESRFMAQCGLVEKMKTSFDYLMDRFETFKKDNFDVSNFANTVMEFREVLERKADKQDIFEIYDNMCKRIDFLETSEYLKVLKKQVEQAAALMFALCRTMVKNGEPPAQIKKQRYELLKHFNSLMNWICGEQPNLNTFSPCRENFEDDEKAITRHSAFMRRRSTCTTRENKRMHIDFPKLG
jgi:hypothetical protein